MKRKIVQTFCAGPTLIITKNISKKDFLQICFLLECAPEELYQGGFQFCNGLKSLRFHLEQSIIPGTSTLIEPTKRSQWPSIDKFTASDWKNNEDVLIHENQEFGTSLKSYFPATAFSLQEINRIKAVIEPFGIIVTNMPTEASISKID